MILKSKESLGQSILKGKHLSISSYVYTYAKKLTQITDAKRTNKKILNSLYTKSCITYFRAIFDSCLGGRSRVMQVLVVHLLILWRYNRGCEFKPSMCLLVPILIY